eukprot:4529836-Pleurochrysis_carterae.AAC.1
MGRMHPWSKNYEVNEVQCHLTTRRDRSHRFQLRAHGVERKLTRVTGLVAIGRGIDDSVRGGTVTRTPISA